MMGIYWWDLLCTAISLYQQVGFHFNGEYDTKGEKIMVYAEGGTSDTL